MKYLKWIFIILLCFPLLMYSQESERRMTVSIGLFSPSGPYDYSGAVGVIGFTGFDVDDIIPGEDYFFDNNSRIYSIDSIEIITPGSIATIWVSDIYSAGSAPISGRGNISRASFTFGFLQLTENGSNFITEEQEARMINYNFSLIDSLLSTGVDTINGLSQTSITLGIDTLSPIGWTPSNDTLYLNMPDMHGAGPTWDGARGLVPQPLQGEEILFLRGDGVWANPSVGGDNWGAQTAQTDNTIDGDGLGPSPLKIAQQGATNGQALLWNGSTWLPGDITASDNQTVDSLILEGNTLILALERDGELPYELDLSQFLDNDTIYQQVDTFELNGNILGISLSDDGVEQKTVDLTSFLDNTDNQTVDSFLLEGNTIILALEDDNEEPYTLDLSSLVTTSDSTRLVEDSILVYTNGTEIGRDTIRLNTTGTQNLVYNGLGDLSITGGNSVDLSDLLDNDTIYQVIDTFEIASNELRLSISDDGELYKSVDLTPYINTDNQTVDTFSFDGTTLTLALERDSEDPYEVDLSSLVGNDSTRLEEDSILVYTFNGELGRDTIRLADLNNIDSTRVLEDSIIVSWLDGVEVDRDTIRLAGTGFSDTDDQQVDNFSLNSNILTLEIQDDGQPPHTVDLSGYLDDTTIADSTRLSEDSILIGYLDGAIVTRDTIRLPSSEDLDEQTVDSFFLDYLEITLALENDNEEPYELDLRENIEDWFNDFVVPTGNLVTIYDDSFGFYYIRATQDTTRLEEDSILVHRNGVVLSRDTIRLPGSTDTDNQTVDSLLLEGTDLILALEDDNEAPYILDLSSLLDNTDDQTVDSFLLESTNIILALEDDKETPYVIDLSPIIPIVDSTRLVEDSILVYYNNGELRRDTIRPPQQGDNQTLTYNGLGDLSISNGNSVDLSDLLDNTDDQTVDSLLLNGNTLVLALEDDKELPYEVDLSQFLDNTDNQQIDTLELVGTILGISLSNDGVEQKTVDLASLQDGIGTDDQQIDSFFIEGNTVILAVEDDNQTPHTIDLTPYINDTIYQDLGWTQSTGALTITGGTGVTILPMVGASDVTDGEQGFVPQPMQGEEVLFLRGDGTWANPSVGGDNWGSQVVQSDNTLDGEGTGANNLKIAQQGATNGQALLWDGLTWTPGDIPDNQTVDTFSIISDTLYLALEDDNESPYFVDLKPYLDNDTIYQTLTYNGLGDLVISDGNSVDLSDLLDNTDEQTVDSLLLEGTTLILALENDKEGPYTLDLASLIPSLDSTRLLEDSILVYYNDGELGRDTIRLPASVDSDNQTVDSLIMVGNNLVLALEDDNELPYEVDLSQFLDDTDQQTVDSFLLESNLLILTLENDKETPYTVDLSGYLDNTDDQTVDSLLLEGTTLVLALEDDNESPYTLDLASLIPTLDSTRLVEDSILVYTNNGVIGRDTIRLPASTDNQTLIYNGLGDLAITNGNSVDLSDLLDNTDNQTVDSLLLEGTTLILALEDDNEAEYTVDLSSLDTDNQTVDSFLLESNNLILALEDDNETPYVVDLSVYLDNTDSQQVDTFEIVNDILGISLSGDGQPQSVVDLTPYKEIWYDSAAYYRFHVDTTLSINSFGLNKDWTPGEPLAATLAIHDSNPRISFTDEQVDLTANQITAFSTFAELEDSSEIAHISAFNINTGGLYVQTINTATSTSAHGVYNRMLFENDPQNEGAFVLEAWKHDGAGGLTSLIDEAYIMRAYNANLPVFSVRGDGDVNITGFYNGDGRLLNVINPTTAAFSSLQVALDSINNSGGSDTYASVSFQGVKQTVGAPKLDFDTTYIKATELAQDSLHFDITRPISDIVEGLALDKPDLDIVNTGGTLYLEVEKMGGGDVQFLLDGQIQTLDCTTGPGTGGKARVALVVGADANNPVLNYFYVTGSGGTATLQRSGNIPTGLFSWIGKAVVPDITTWTTEGEYVFQRFTESFNNKGQIANVRERIRLGESHFASGVAPSFSIDSGPSPDTTEFTTTSGKVYQLHLQDWAAFNDEKFYYGNGINIYDRLDDLNEALQLQDGTSLTNNDYFSLVIWGGINIDAATSKVFVNQPIGVYGAADQAQADISNYADYSVPEDAFSVAFMIARIVLQYKSTGGGQLIEVETYDLRGQPPGVRVDGTAVLAPIANNSFPDNLFNVYDDADVTKRVLFDLSSVTAGQDRTLIVPDQSGTIALIGDVSLDSFLLDSDILYASISNDGVPAETVDLSPYSNLDTLNGQTGSRQWFDFSTTGSSVPVFLSSQDTHRLIIPYADISTYGLVSASLQTIDGIKIFDDNVGFGTQPPDSNQVHIQGNMYLSGAFRDGLGWRGDAGQILSSTGTATDWISGDALEVTNPYGGLDLTLKTALDSIKANIDAIPGGHDAVTLVTTSHDYLSIVDQAITLGPIDALTDITGDIGGLYVDNPTGGTNTLDATIADLDKYTVASEVTTTTTATRFSILPVNVTSGNVTINPFASPVAGDWFMITDSREQAGTEVGDFIITVDFVSAGDNLHGSSQNYELNLKGKTVEFIYMNSTIGWIVKD